MNEPITVTTAVKFRRWQAPNYAIQDVPPRQRQEGFSLADLYEKAGQRNPFVKEAA